MKAVLTLFCISRCNVSLQCSDGSLLAFIAGDMPDHLRTSLERNVVSVLGEDVLRSVESADDVYSDFGAIHFSWYSRCATKVRFIISISMMLFN